jgi:hypothetical protein
LRDPHGREAAERPPLESVLGRLPGMLPVEVRRELGAILAEEASRPENQ